LEAKLKEDGGQIESLAKELEQEKNSKQEVLARVEELNQNLEQQKKIKIDLEKKIDQAQESAKKMQAQLKELESKKAELEAKVKSIETEIPGVELGEIVVTPDTTVTTKEPAAKPKKQKTEKDLAAQELKGAVLVVNKEYNFVVINLGSKDGVGLGDVFSVSRSNKYIGDIKVEKIHESMSAAGFVSSDMKGKVNEGDKVVQKVK
jgi:seryl-tRNA synthetase